MQLYWKRKRNFNILIENSLNLTVSWGQFVSCIHVFHSTTSHSDKCHDASHTPESEPSVMSNNAHLVHWCGSVHGCAQQVQTDRLGLGWISFSSWIHPQSKWKLICWELSKNKLSIQFFKTHNSTNRLYNFLEMGLCGMGHHLHWRNKVEAAPPTPTPQLKWTVETNSTLNTRVLRLKGKF